jgi:hypothetical protein
MCVCDRRCRAAGAAGAAGDRGRRRLPPVLPRSGLRDLPVLRLREAPGEVQLLSGAQRLHAPSFRRDAADLLLTGMADLDQPAALPVGFGK